MDELLQWLTRQIDEDAWLAMSASPGPWQTGPESDEVLAAGVVVANGLAFPRGQLRATVDHVARWDPTRVLQDARAKRAMVSYYRRYWPEREHAGEGPAREAMAQMIKELAVGYAERPGYRPQWRP